MGQRDEHLPSLTAVLPDYGVLADKPIPVPQPLEDPLGRVALLPGNAQVRLQYPVDDAGEGLQLGPFRRILPPVVRRDRVGGHLAHCVPVQAEHPGRLPNAHAFDHHCLADPQYTSTWYIHPTIQRLIFQPMDGRGRSSLQPPNVSDYPPARSTLPSPFTDALYSASLGHLARPALSLDKFIRDKSI